MSINPSPVKHGTAGGVEINVDFSRIDHAAAPVHVTLSADYMMLRPPGAPTRPGFTGSSPPNLDYPRTVTSGTRILVSKAEADALVAAGKASYS
jgi:hypothetical protein